MIARLWKGIFRSGKGDLYIQHLQTKTLPRLEKTQGFIKMEYLQKETTSGKEFLIITYWESVDAIRQFAGGNLEAAVVVSNGSRELMSSFDDFVLHYEVVDL